MTRHPLLPALFLALLASTALSQTTSQPAPAKDPFAASLSLRLDRTIADPTHPAIAWITQTATIPAPASTPLKAHLTLLPATPADAPPLKDLGTFDLPSRDLAKQPFGLSAELDNLPDGNYRLSATISTPTSTLATLEQPLWLVKGIDARRPNILDRLAKISGHDSVKASILYPFDLARVVNSGKRGFNGADLGLNEKDQPDYYDFPKALARSEQLLTALEAGKDPLFQAKGDVERAYNFTEAGEIMPYRLYVPSTWDGKTPLPLVFILHGNTRNQDFYFDRNQNIIPKAAEKHGFMLAAPFGYHPNGGYNLAAMPGSRGGRGGPSTFMDGMPAARLTELSELDSMHVFDLVKKEYPIDPKRTFLFGYSAGGNGGYYIGGKYADNFAAIALGGASVGPNNYPYFDKFKSLNTAFFIYFGALDSAAVQSGSAAMVDALKQHGIDAALKPYPGVDHAGGPAAAVADAFNFFDSHPRK